MNTKQNELNVDEFLSLLDEAIAEINDLQFAIEFDEEFMSDALVFINPLKQELIDIKKQVQAGNNAITEQDFKFVQLIDKINPSILPFKGLLNRLNNACIVEK